MEKKRRRRRRRSKTVDKKRLPWLVLLNMRLDEYS
jgi:hypothetical protein